MHEQQLQLAQLATVYQQEDMPEAARLAQTALRKVTRDEIWLAVCGHFSAGKSTLLNDWLGEGVLPTSPIPTSANIVTLKKGAPRAAIAINDTDWIDLSGETLSAIGDYCKVEEIKEIEYSLASFPYGDDVVLMDTPGIDSTDARHRQATERSLFLADHLFFMMDYNHVQSEQNIALMKQFSAEGRPYSIIINQIDKHDEQEIPFVAFRQSLESAFAHHAIQPNDMFYVSLRHHDHPGNERLRLQAYVRQLIEEARSTSEARATDLIATLAQRQSDRVAATLADQPEIGRHASEIQTRLQQLDKTEVWYTAFRREFFKHQSPIVASAPIMTYEFRELLKAYLESLAPSFKVGLLFSKEKTRQERLRREEVALRELNRLLDIHLRPHLIKYAEDIVRDLDLSETLLPSTDFLPPAPSTLLTDQVKPGASLSGESVLQYSRDIETAMANWVTKQTEPWVRSIEQALSLETRTRLDAIRSEQDELYHMLDVLALRRQLESRLASLSNVRTIDVTSDQMNRLQQRHFVEPSLLPTKQQAQQEIEVAPTVDFVDTNMMLYSDFSYENAVCEILSSHPLFHSRAEALRRKLKRAEDQQFTLAIFGAFSAGKSSTLNALFGESVLPTSPNPLTASITKILPPDTEANRSARITFKTETELSDELAGYGTTLHTLDVDHPFVNAVKRAPLTHLGTSEVVDYETFCAFVAEEEKSCIVKEIELYLDSPWARRGIVFVDTPGADSQFNRHSEVQFSYMRDADAVLFVTYYNHAFTEADRELVIQLGRVQGTGDHQMFFLVNASDLAADAAERDAVTDYVATQLTKLGVRQPTVLPISSRNALNATDEGFDRFTKTLERYIDEDLRRANVMRIQQETASLVTTFDEMMRELDAEESVKQARAEQLHTLRATLPALDVTGLLVPFMREANELLAHLETRSLLRLADFVKETFHPVEVDGSKASLHRALGRTVEKYTYDVQQELQVFQYRLEKYMRRLASDSMKRETARLADALPTLEFELELDTSWLRAPIVPLDWDANDYRSTLKHYKQANQFFEGDGRAALRDDLSNQFRASVRIELARVASTLEEVAADALRSTEQAADTAWRKELETLIDAELSFLADGQTFASLRDQLDAIRKD